MDRAAYLDELKTYRWSILFISLCGLFAIFGGVMEPDGALYASIAKNIVQKGDWINLYVRGQDWLDKPHLTFWITALSFKFFGIHEWAYKLPSLLIGWWGVYYLYRLSRKWYDERVSLMAVIIYMTAFHVLISNFDVRAELYLTTFSLAAIFHYLEAYEGKNRHLIYGSLFLACAVMVKGIFVAIPLLGGFILYWMRNRQWEELLNPKWWGSFLLVLLFITPELYCLYRQFDIHPEKWVFGQQGVSGLRFFFWDSQFGRFFNTGPIKGKGDLFLFVHTILWAFLPWSILFYGAVYRKVRAVFSRKIPLHLSQIVAYNALVAFLLFSLSKFQLPHYILLIFPHFALLTARYLEGLTPRTLRVFSRIQQVLFLLIVSIILWIGFQFPLRGIWFLGALLLLLSGGALCWKISASSKQVVMFGLATSLVFSIFAYGFFYPSILVYQGGMTAGKWLAAHAHKRTIYVYKAESFAFDFYAPVEVRYIDDAQLTLLREAQIWVWMPKHALNALTPYYQVRILHEEEYFHITKLTKAFLNAKNRPDVLERFCIVEINKSVK